jgi:hypothetical protein
MPNGVQNVIHAKCWRVNKNSTESALTFPFNFMVIAHIQVQILGKIVDLT